MTVHLINTSWILSGMATVPLGCTRASATTLHQDSHSLENLHRKHSLSHLKQVIPSCIHTESAKSGIQFRISSLIMPSLRSFLTLQLDLIPNFCIPRESFYSNMIPSRCGLMMVKDVPFKQQEPVYGGKITPRQFMRVYGQLPIFRLCQTMDSQNGLLTLVVFGVAII